MIQNSGGNNNRMIEDVQCIGIIFIGILIWYVQWLYEKWEKIA